MTCHRASTGPPTPRTTCVALRGRSRSKEKLDDAEEAHESHRQERQQGAHQAPRHGARSSTGRHAKAQAIPTTFTENASDADPHDHRVLPPIPGSTCSSAPTASTRPRSSAAPSAITARAARTSFNGASHTPNNAATKQEAGSRTTTGSDTHTLGTSRCCPALRRIVVPQVPSPGHRSHTATTTATRPPSCCAATT